MATDVTVDTSGQRKPAISWFQLETNLLGSEPIYFGSKCSEQVKFRRVSRNRTPGVSSCVCSCLTLFLFIIPREDCPLRQSQDVTLWTTKWGKLMVTRCTTSHKCHLVDPCSPHRSNWRPKSGLWHNYIQAARWLLIFLGASPLWSVYHFSKLGPAAWVRVQPPLLHVISFSTQSIWF